MQSAVPSLFEPTIAFPIGRCALVQTIGIEDRFLTKELLYTETALTRLRQDMTRPAMLSSEFQTRRIHLIPIPASGRAGDAHRHYLTWQTHPGPKTL